MLTALVAALVKRCHDRAVAGIADEGVRDAAQDGLQFLTALAVLAGVYLPHPCFGLLERISNGGAIVIWRRRE